MPSEPMKQPRRFIPVAQGKARYWDHACVLGLEATQGKRVVCGFCGPYERVRGGWQVVGGDDSPAERNDS